MNRLVPPRPQETRSPPAGLPVMENKRRRAIDIDCHHLCRREAPQVVRGRFQIGMAALEESGRSATVADVEMGSGAVRSLSNPITHGSLRPVCQWRILGRCGRTY